MSDVEKHIQTEYPPDTPKKLQPKIFTCVKLDLDKYVKTIYFIGGFCLFDQFYHLFAKINNKKNVTQSVKVMARGIIKQLEELGLIKTDYLNNNKYIYLKKIGIALALWNYKKSTNINLKEQLKTGKLLFNLTKTQYYIETGNFFSHHHCFSQLQKITIQAYKMITNNNNKFKYDLQLIRKIIEAKDFSSVNKLLSDTNENTNKLGILRILWIEIANIFKELIMQNQTISNTPYHYEIFSQFSGEIIVHYVPQIIVIDYFHDKEYYNNFVTRMFYKFHKISTNFLIDSKEIFLAIRKFKDNFRNIFCYSVLLITDKDKTNLINEKNQISGALLNVTYHKITLENYFKNNSAKKSDKIKEKQNQKIESFIIDKFMKI